MLLEWQSVFFLQRKFGAAFRFKYWNTSWCTWTWANDDAVTAVFELPGALREKTVVGLNPHNCFLNPLVHCQIM